MDVLQSLTWKSKNFLWIRRKGYNPHNTQYQSYTRRLMISARLGRKCLTSHSFRGGAATVALRGGVSQDDIKRMDRWKSTSAMLHYTEPTPI
ncbi:hypothetical protein Aduo_006344 [Ancylostoma duodenale]